MSARRAWRLLAVAVVAAAALAGPAVASSPNANSNTDASSNIASSAAGEPVNSCGDVLFLGVRGSGQTSADEGGFGREMVLVRDQLVSRLPGSVVVDRTLDYPSEAVSVLAPTASQARAFASGGLAGRAAALASWKHSRLDRYLGSIATGVDRLRAALITAQARCPTRRTLLAGYSQGAMVVHRTLDDLAREGRRAVLSSVSAVGLLADGDRVANTMANSLGDAPDQGRGLTAFAGLRRTDVPAGVADRTLSWCDRRDLVCNASFTNLARSERGVMVHADYGMSFARTTAAFMARRVPEPPDAGVETGRVVFEHPTWGTSTMVTSENEAMSNGSISVFDGAHRLRWRFRTERAWSEMALNIPATDASGQLFVNWNPGRYSGVTVLDPVPDGFADHGTLPIDGQYWRRFYYAQVEDTDNDGTFEIRQFSNDCRPTCAEGTVTSELFGWDGQDYVHR